MKINENLLKPIPSPGAAPSPGAQGWQLRPRCPRSAAGRFPTAPRGRGGGGGRTGRAGVRPAPRAPRAQRLLEEKRSPGQRQGRAPDGEGGRARLKVMWEMGNVVGTQDVTGMWWDMDGEQ